MSTTRTSPQRMAWRWLANTLGTDWERERRDTLLLLLAATLTVATHVAHLPLWCSAGFALLALWRLSLVFSGHPLPGTLVRTTVALACVVGIGLEFDAMLGREVGVALLVLFLGLKLMELRARRDTVVVICLCFFLLLTSFFESQGATAVALVWLASQTLLIALLTLYSGQHELRLGRRVRITSMLMLQALPLAAAMFVLFPRVSAPLWGKPQTTASGRTGLSDSMTPGSITNLVNHDEVAFRVEFKNGAPDPNTLYWRGPTLGAFNGQTWHPLVRDEALAPRPETLMSRNGPAIRYQVTLEPHPRRWLFALETPIAIPHGPGLQARIAPDFEFLADLPVTQRLRYEGAAQPGARIGLNETPESLLPWLATPAERNPRTQALADAWRQDQPSPQALVTRALRWFSQEGFRYTMQAPPLGRHSVDDFLFRTRAGFCEHYASAFVVLMRHLGIPARVVTGYHGAEHNVQDDYWIVRQSDAHAWSEVWMAGQGWVRVDPTHAVAPSRIERSAVIEQGRQAWSGGLTDLKATPWFKQWRWTMDALAHNFNQWVLNYDRGRQEDLLKRLGLDASKASNLALALVVTVALGLGLVALITLRPATRRDPVVAAYQQFCLRLAQAGLPRRADETAPRFMRRIERLLEPEHAAHAHEIVALYQRLRYDPTSLTPEHLAALRRQVRSFQP